MTVSTFEGEPMFICIDESIVNDQGEYGLHELPLAVCKGGGRCSRSILLLVEILNSVG